MYEHERYKREEHFEHGKKIEEQTLVIYVDDDPLNPREDWDNFGHMVCFHRRYNLGDKHDLRTSDFESWDDMANYLYNHEKAAIVIPIRMYEHSGITISASNEYPYNDRWDAGQIGFIYVTKEDIRKEYNVKKVTKEILERARQVLLGEIEVYDMYLRGDVYGFQLLDKNEEIIDSCWGYYGDDGIKAILEECKFTKDMEVY